MSVGLNYQSWVNARPAERNARAVPLQARATASAAMRTVALSDAVLLLVAVAALGLPLATWWTWAAVAMALGALGAHRALPPADHPERGPRGGFDRWPAPGHRSWCLALAKVPGAVDGPVDRDRRHRGGRRSSWPGARTYWLVRLMRTRGWFAERTLFVGAGDVSAKMAATLDEHPEYGLHPVGFLDEVDSAGLPLPLLRRRGHAPHGAVRREDRPRRRGLRRDTRVGHGRRLPGL